MELSKIKKAVRAVGASSVMVLFLGIGSSYASIDIGGGNDCTGPNSENNNRYDIEDVIDFNIDNRSDVENLLNYDLESGHNRISCNTSVGDVFAGDVSGDIEIINDLRNDDFDVDFMDFGDVDVDMINDTTGCNSVNTNRVNITNEATVDITNAAEFNNDIDLRANTGRNSIRNNTCVGDVIGGDIDLNAVVENRAGTNGDIVLPSFGDMSVSADLMNGLTGPNSENRNILNVDNTIDFDMTNESVFNNDLNVRANTGNNNIGCNTVVGDIATGDANVDLRVLNSTY